MTKFIFVTGGVVSSIGKGITAASLGRLLKNRGVKVTLQKFDPYMNPDPGTISPYQHGEVFVTADGAETDLDLGHYERFVNINLDRHSSNSMGGIYAEVIAKERQGFYDGKTVQVIPHITDEVKKRMLYLSEHQDVDVVITEIGGTVGDIESLAFLEAIRQLRQDLGKENTLYIHVTLVPYISVACEAKTKPTQHSVKDLRSVGIQPDMIVLRSSCELTKDILDKVALFCDIDQNAVMQIPDLENIYEIPVLLADQGFDRIVIKKLGLSCGELDLSQWQVFCDEYKQAAKTLNLALVGKYVELHDAYLSVMEALRHSAIFHKVKLNIKWVDASALTAENYEQELADVAGILVPNGFGSRGIAGKELAANYARTHKVPYLGIGLGMHTAVSDFARTVVGLPDADVSEVCAEEDGFLLRLWNEEAGCGRLGGTLRLGALGCSIVPGSKAYECYGTESISERHRHRYEVKPKCIPFLRQHGMIVSGYREGDATVEIIEIPDHPFFIGCQFHPEFKSHPQQPHPLFRGFVGAAIEFARR